MKSLIYLLLVHLFFLGCQSNTSENPVSVPTVVKESGPLTFNIKKLDGAVYTKSLLQDQQRILTDRLCKESKGYNQNEWPGMNACEWATEKYWLKKDKDLVSRKDDLLTLNLENKKTLVLSHQVDKAGKKIYHIYNGYIKEIDSFVVLEKQNDQCLSSLLINAKDGSQQIMGGIPYFSADKQKAIVTSYQSASSKCNNGFDLWQYQSGKMLQTSNYQSQSWGIDQLIWIKDNQVYIKKGMLDQSAPQYAVIHLSEQG